MTEVTLIGEHIAEPGQEFVFAGEASGCEECPYRRQCLNLESGRSYRITSVREGAQALPCAVHAGDVVAVEVEPVSVTVNVPDRQALSGNKTRLAGDCPYVECPSHRYCVPDGLSMDVEYRIREVQGDPPHETCAMDRDLTQVVVEPD